jgi:hypothetical protein
MTNAVHRLLDLEDEGIMILKKHSEPLTHDTASHPRKTESLEEFHPSCSVTSRSIIQEINCRENTEQSTFFAKQRICQFVVFTFVSVFWDVTLCEVKCFILKGQKDQEG